MVAFYYKYFQKKEVITLYKKIKALNLPILLLSIILLFSFSTNVSAEESNQNTYEIEAIDESDQQNESNEGPSLACATCYQYKSSIVSQTLISRKYIGTVTISRSTTISGQIKFKYKGFELSIGGKNVSSSSKKFKEYKVTKNYKIRIKTYNPMGRLISNEVVTRKITTTERVPI
ncbi:LMxysn_1693 family intestinal colonization protein [Virgibacillus soli]|uniref:Uncharacterized protein n=1 Tax=Paracerasibacillus soli TaxID=480284 RepID=A0ABU5CQ52_9BACI|nr:hypothetical protein [Virgibacillus soli]MDY0408484.1 hypothetical protein [Virgibacillus soli]